MVLLGPGGGIELANDVGLRLLRATSDRAGERQSRWVAIQTVAGLLGRVLDEMRSSFPRWTWSIPSAARSIVSGPNASGTRTAVSAISS
jgi:hypothetical protein